MSDGFNPYAPPKTTPGGLEEPTGAALASRGSRLGSALIDSFVAALLMIPLLIQIFKTAEAGETPSLANVPALTYLWMLPIFVIQSVLIAISGQSIGKKVVGIRIVKYSDGTLAGFVPAVLVRFWLPSLITQVPVVGLLFNLVDVLFIFSEERRCIHDRWAGTKVVVV